MVTVLGSGLLVGTALAVIIPEGVNALYEESVHCMYSFKLALYNIIKMTANTESAYSLLNDVMV